MPTLFVPDAPLWSLVLRGGVVYLFLITALRLSGRRWCPSCQATFHVINDPPKRPMICDVCGTGLVQRDDDRPENVQQRLQAFHQQTAPLKALYQERGLLRRIDGVGSPDGILAEIRLAVAKVAK